MPFRHATTAVLSVLVVADGLTGSPKAAMAAGGVADVLAD
jgi:hypothetical protein